LVQLAQTAQRIMDTLALDTVGQLMYIRALMSGKPVTRDAFDAVANACRAYERQNATRGGVERSAVQRLALHFETHRDDPDNALLGLRATLAVDDAVVSLRSFDLMARVRESEQTLVAPQLHRELLSWLALPDAELLCRARALARCAVEVWPAGALVLVPDDASGGTGRMRFGRFSGRRVGLALGIFTSPAERTDTLYQLAHVLPVPTDVLGANSLCDGAECAFAVFFELEEAGVSRCMTRFLTLHGFDSELNKSLALTPEAPEDVRASSVHSLHRNERLLSEMKRSNSRDRERCIAYVRRSARAAATRMVRHCDSCLSETLEIDRSPVSSADGEPDALGRPLVTFLLQHLREMPEHAAHMVAVLDREVQASAARHRAASRALANRLDGVRTGVAKQELHSWWTTLIKEATLAHMRAVGVDLSAVGDDYTTRPPSDLNLVRRNCEILAALLDADTDTYNTKALLDSMCNTVYPRVNQFIDDALVAVAIACAVAPSVYERQYDASVLLSSLRAHLAEALAAESKAPLSKSSRDDDDNSDAVAVIAVMSSATADDDSDLDTASDSPYESIRTSGNFLARRSMSSISGGLCLSDSDRSVMSIANAFGFSSASSLGASLQWCETTLDDVAYLITMKQLERAGVSAERLGPVPVSGLVVGRITRCLQEHRTVLELFGDGDANARVRSTSARSVLANVSLFRRRRADVDLSPRSPRFWFSRSNRVTEPPKREKDTSTVGTNDDGSLGSAKNSDDELSEEGGPRSCRSADDDRDPIDHPRNQRHRHSEGSSSSTHSNDIFRSHHRRIARHRHSFGSVLTANGSTNSEFSIDENGVAVAAAVAAAMGGYDDDADDNDDDDNYHSDSSNHSHSSGGRRRSSGGKSPKLRQSSSDTRIARVGDFAASDGLTLLSPNGAESRWKAAHTARRRKSAADSINEPSGSRADEATRAQVRVRVSATNVSSAAPTALGMHRVDKQARNQST
jgi:hypothetical protein